MPTMDLVTLAPRSVDYDHVAHRTPTLYSRPFSSPRGRRCSPTSIARSTRRLAVGAVSGASLEDGDVSPLANNRLRPRVLTNMLLVAFIVILRMTSATNGTVILTDGTVETTTDGGKTFTTVVGPPGKAPVLLDDGTLVWFGQGRGSCGDVFGPAVAVTARRAFAFACFDTAMGGKQSVDLMATSDVNATWKIRATARPDSGPLRYFGHKDGLVFFDATHGLAFGGTAIDDALWVDETFDGGASWKPSTTSFAQHGRVHVVGALQPISQVLSSGTAVFALPFHAAGGIETDVFVTRDRGATWIEIAPLTDVASVQALDANHLVALGADDTILRWDGSQWTEAGKVAAGQRIWFRTYDEGWIIDGDAITRWSP